MAWLDLLVGFRWTVVAVTLGVVIVFWPTLLRIRATLLQRKSVPYADRLGAGIWFSAAGAFVNNAIQLWIDLTDPGEGDTLDWLALVAALAVGFVTAGYYLHMTAWRGAYYGRINGFAVRWALVLLAVLLIGTFGNAWLRQAHLLANQPGGHGGGLIERHRHG